MLTVLRRVGPKCIAGLGGRLQRALGVLAVSLFVLTGCVGRPALRESVLGYDETVSALDQQILLLNIARLSLDRPPHFTVTSSIAATFNFETSAGISRHHIRAEWV